MTRRALFKISLRIINLGFCVGIQALAEPFQWAKSGQVSSLRLDVEKDPSLTHRVDSQGNTLLAVAARNGHAEAAEFLLKKKSDINHKNQNGKTPLFLAIENSQPKAALLLLSKKPDLSHRFGAQKETLLHLAARGPHEKVIEKIYEQSPDLLESQNSRGETPVFESVRSSQSKSLQVFIKLGANVKIKNSKGESLLDLVDPSLDKKIHRILKRAAKLSE